jgi:hypothetical protein
LHFDICEKKDGKYWIGMYHAYTGDEINSKEIVKQDDLFETLESYQMKTEDVIQRMNDLIYNMK